MKPASRKRKSLAKRGTTAAAAASTSATKRRLSQPSTVGTTSTATDDPTIVALTQPPDSHLTEAQRTELRDLLARVRSVDPTFRVEKNNIFSNDRPMFAGSARVDIRSLFRQLLQRKRGASKNVRHLQSYLSSLNINQYGSGSRRWAFCGNEWIRY